jgi:hypothetical protein
VVQDPGYRGNGYTGLTGDFFDVHCHSPSTAILNAKAATNRLAASNNIIPRKLQF